MRTPFIQAPLSGYSDSAMRRLALDFGAPLTFAGVVLDKSAANPRVMRKPEFRPGENEHPIGAQIFGNDPEIMSKAAVALQDAGYDIIDLNFACPTPKVLRRKRGGFLLNEPDRVIEIYRRVRDSVSCPLTMKLRAGYDSSSESYDKFFKIADESSKLGIDGMLIHTRNVMQRYTGKADDSILAEIKRSFPETKIIGSGDFFEPVSIIERLKKNNLDGVIIARGAIGNPWIYRSLNALWAGEPLPEKPSLNEQAEVIIRHYEMLSEIIGPKKAVGFFRKYLIHYCKLHPARKLAQKTLLAANTPQELMNLIDAWYFKYDGPDNAV